MKTKFTTLVVALLCATGAFSQQGLNLLPVEQWTPGNGSVGDFTRLGVFLNNSRIYQDGPHGNNVLVWESKTNMSSTTEGGFSITNIPIDPAKTYQYSVWVKNPNGNNDGRIQFRPKSGTVLNMNGSAVGTPYFFHNLIPSDDQWYLMVAYIHGHATTNTASKGQIFRQDGTFRQKINDFKFDPTATLGQMVLGYKQSETATNVQYFWNPRIEEVNGNETTISDLVTTIPNKNFVNGNLLPSYSWEPGTGADDNFGKYGETDENIREYGVGPYEDNVVLWKTSRMDDASPAGGGFYRDHQICDPNTTYRYMVWVKRHTALICGGSYIGFYNSSNERVANVETNLPSANPYVWAGDLPVLDKWYLVVGYVHGADYQHTAHRSGVYDIATGQKVFAGKDFKFLPNAKNNRFRILNTSCQSNNAGSYYWNPTIEEVNESTTPISSYFIGNDDLWTRVNAEDAVYNGTGTVGIGLLNETIIDPAYKLMVDGVVKTREVKVNPDNWADFVFEPDYKLPSLNEVEKYIKEKGHLPDIPSALEVKRDGIFIGEMGAKLLQKIEELTLYQIEQQRRIEELENKLMFLKNKSK